jgi:hypothetical protein
MKGRSKEFEAEVLATCTSDGTPLRAPTADRGLAPACRDSFNGQVHLQARLITVCHPVDAYYISRLVFDPQHMLIDRWCHALSDRWHCHVVSDRWRCHVVSVM